MKTQFYQFMTLVGDVIDHDFQNHHFRIKLLSGDEVDIYSGETTYFEVLRNLDNLDRNKVASPERQPAESTVSFTLRTHIKKNRMVCVQGIHSVNATKKPAGDGVPNNGGEAEQRVERFDARRVVLMHWDDGRYGWEDTHWWISQISRITHQWLDVLFRDKRDFTADDFASLYRTNLNILGGHTDNNIQECATLSRFLYGLSSAYMLTGLDRFYNAAQAAANYLCDTFRSPSHDENYCFWKFGRRSTVNSSEDIIPSQNPDDIGTYALYEQIYALSGLTQFYRITQDRKILDIIRKTINAFQDFFHDTKRDGDPCFTGKGGYFSHIDPVTMRPDSPSLDRGNGYNNRMKKNWNSIGDHIPAYLINLLLTIDPLPDDHKNWKELRTLCWSILDECVDNIIKYFPDEIDPQTGQPVSMYVRERFEADWTPDKTWGWQQDRAVVGHNLKIAWNLTRCGHYYCYRNTVLKEEGLTDEAAKYGRRAEQCYKLAQDIGDKMAKVGVDLARGGIFDAVERKPANGMPTEFTWGCTKDFWQQEQAILAYLILHGIDERKEYLEYARYCSAFWNLFFLDRDNFRIRFRTSESGEPITEGAYADQAGHAIAGYHAFELGYLAHFYTRCYVTKVADSRGRTPDDNFVIYFRPNKNDNVRAINVMPDFVREDEVEIIRVKVNGEVVAGLEQDGFRVDLRDYPAGSTVAVEFRPIRRSSAQSLESIKAQRPHALTFHEVDGEQPALGDIPKLDLQPAL